MFEITAHKTSRYILKRFVKLTKRQDSRSKNISVLAGRLVSYVLRACFGKENVLRFLANVTYTC